VAANAVPVLENVLRLSGVARDGTLVYIPTRGESSARLVWVDREGRPTAVAGERRDYSHLDLAPDDRRALLNVDGGSIYLLDWSAVAPSSSASCGARREVDSRKDIKIPSIQWDSFTLKTRMTRGR
jgi:hypothetical protein